MWQGKISDDHRCRPIVSARATLFFTGVGVLAPGRDLGRRGRIAPGVACVSHTVTVYRRGRIAAPGRRPSADRRIGGGPGG